MSNSLFRIMSFVSCQTNVACIVFASVGLRVGLLAISVLIMIIFQLQFRQSMIQEALVVCCCYLFPI